MDLKNTDSDKWLKIREIGEEMNLDPFSP